MFGTVIIDAYRKEEATEMVNAIDDLCSPKDNHGWASARIYCFGIIMRRQYCILVSWEIWQKDLKSIMEYCRLRKAGNG